MKRIALFTFILLMAAGLYAQIPKISTQPGCKNYRVGEKHLPNVPACRKTFHTPPLALSSVVGSYPEGSSTTEVTTASQPLYFLTPDPPCGYGGGVQQDNKGACSLTIILHNGPPEAVCVLGYDDTLHAPVVTCTWKPKEKP